MKTWPWRSSLNTALETPGKASETVSLTGKAGQMCYITSLSVQPLETIIEADPLLWLVDGAVRSQ